MGLAEGTQVLYEGYPVGIIDAIRRRTDTGEPHFRVEVSVERGWRIPEDSVAEIAASGLLSAVVIDIREGASPTALEPGAEIPSVESGPSRRDARPRLGEGTPAILENLESFTTALNETASKINDILRPANTARIERILRNLEVTSDRVATLTDGLTETRSELHDVVGTMNRLLDEHEDDLGHAMVDLHDSLEAVAVRIDHLEATTRNMNEFSSQFRANPGLILRGRELPDDVTAAD